MGSLTFQIIDGLEAGQVFRHLNSPVTIGREEDNSIRLNDERISRFHAKVQLNSGRAILTDLESTNGTRVNGHPVRMRVLSIGDQVQVGRCTLIFGSPEEVEALIAAENQSESSGTDLRQRDLTVPFPVAYPSGPPALPRQLNPLQAVELSNLLDFVRTEILWSISQVQEPLTKEPPPFISLPNAAWHRLQQLPLHLSQLLELIANPDDDPGLDTEDAAP